MTAERNHLRSDVDTSQNAKDTFVEIVLEGGGLPQIAATLANILDRAVLLVDQAGEVMTHAPADGSLVDSEEPLSVQLLEDHEEVVVGGQTMPCHSYPIRSGVRQQGHLLVLGPSTERPQDRLAIDAAAIGAALVLSTRYQIIEHEQKYQSSYMYQLLRGSITDTEDALTRSELLGWDLSRRSIVLTVRSDDPTGVAEELHPIPLALRSLVLSRDPKAALVILSDEVVVVTEAFPWKDGIPTSLRYAQSLQAAATQAYGLSMSVGMSREVTGVLEIPRAYDQAVTAFRVGRRVGGPGVASHFSELGIDRLLSLIENQQELTNFAREVLGELAVDTERSVDLRRTLEVLLETNVNIAESARRLHYHYNTLRFRMQKLEQIVGPFRDDPRVRLNAQLALAILRMNREE